MIKIRSQKIDAAELTKRVETIIDDFEKIDKEVFLQKHTKKDEDFLRATIYLNNTKKQKLFRLIQTILIKSKLTFVEIYAQELCVDTKVYAGVLEFLQYCQTHQIIFKLFSCKISFLESKNSFKNK